MVDNVEDAPLKTIGKYAQIIRVYMLKIDKEASENIKEYDIDLVITLVSYFVGGWNLNEIIEELPEYKSDMIHEYYTKMECIGILENMVDTGSDKSE